MAKIATVVIAIGGRCRSDCRTTQRKRQRGELRITRLSEQYKEMQEDMSLSLLDSHQQKAWLKAQKKKAQAGSQSRKGES